MLEERQLNSSHGLVRLCFFYYIVVVRDDCLTHII